MTVVLDALVGLAALAALITLTVAVIAGARRDRAQTALTQALLALLDRMRIETAAVGATALRLEEAAELVAERLAADRLRADAIAMTPGHETGAVADAAAGSGPDERA